MKTLQIGLEWFPEKAGGLNRVYYDCVQYLPQVGVDIDGLVAGSLDVYANSNGKVQAFAPIDAPLLQRWRQVQHSVRQFLSTDDNFLIVSHFALYTFPILSQLKHRPLVFHFHGPWALESDFEGSKNLVLWLKKTLEKFTYQKATCFIVLSQCFRDLLHQEYQIPLERIYIVPGGVDSQRFNINVSLEKAREKLNWPQDRKIIFCVRRLARRMGLENAIAAMVKIRDRYPDTLLYIAGTGELAATLQSQIESLALTDHVKLLGYLPDPDLPLAYRAANFSLVPTVAFEGFGLVVVESLATGTPIIGTPVGGIPEILQPLSPDLLLEGSTSEQIAKGILEVLSNQRQLPSSQACQDYVKQHYAWEIIAQKIKSVYEKAWVA